MVSHRHRRLCLLDLTPKEVLLKLHLYRSDSIPYSPYRSIGAPANPGTLPASVDDPSLRFSGPILHTYDTRSVCALLSIADVSMFVYAVVRQRCCEPVPEAGWPGFLDCNIVCVWGVGT